MVMANSLDLGNDKSPAIYWFGKLLLLCAVKFVITVCSYASLKLCSWNFASPWAKALLQPLSFCIEIKLHLEEKILHMGDYSTSWCLRIVAPIPRSQNLGGGGGGESTNRVKIPKSLRAQLVFRIEKVLNHYKKIKVS